MGGFGALARVVHIWVAGTWLGAVVFVLFLAPATDLPTTLGLAAPSAAMWQRFSWLLLLALPVLFASLILGWAPMQAALRFRAMALALSALVALVSVRWLGPAWLASFDALSRVPSELSASDPALANFHSLAVYVTAAALLQGLVAFYLVGAAVLARKKRQGLGGGIEL